MRRNFLCGFEGREPSCRNDLKAQLRAWVWGVAHQRVHGTTRQPVSARGDAEQFSLQPIAGRPSYPYGDEELRKVARDAYVCWQGSRYSVPWEYAGKQVWVRNCDCEVESRYQAQRIARHMQAPRKHVIVTQAEHHAGIPLGAARPDRKTLVHLRQTAPVVEIRPLAAYASAATGGARRLPSSACKVG